jgi:hypothetical protein
VETGNDRQATEDCKPVRCLCVAWLNINQAIFFGCRSEEPDILNHIHTGE